MAIITISRGTYSGALALAEYISRNFGYRLITREDIIGKLGEYGMSDDRLNSARHRQLSVRQRKDLEWTHYLACFRAALCEEMRGENMIYLGDNGHAVLKNFPNVLHVRVITNLDYRIDNFMKRNDYVIDRKEAKKLIRKIDEQRGKWVKTIYKEDVDNPSEFDITINLDPMSIPDACGLIQTTMELSQFKTTVESQKKLEDTIFAANVRAKIATEIEIIDDNIEVEAEDNVLSIKGTVHSIEEWDELKELLRQLPEVEDMESHLETPVEIPSHH